MKTNHIVFLDIDHTLYDAKAKKVHPSSIDALKKLQKRGDTLIAIATGRAYYMLDVIQEVRRYIDIYITINGQLIYQDDNIIFDDPMDTSLVAKAKALFQKHDMHYGFIGKQTQAINRFDDDAKALFDRDHLPYPIEAPDFDHDNAVYQMWAFADERRMKKLQTHFDRFEFVPWLTDGFDVIEADKTKRDGVMKVLDKLNLSKDQAICFGDGHNDIEMLAAIPRSFAMGQSPQPVKNAANYITDAYDQDGIYNALKKLNLID